MMSKSRTVLEFNVSITAFTDKLISRAIEYTWYGKHNLNIQDAYFNSIQHRLYETSFG